MRETEKVAKVVVLTVNDVHDVLPGDRRGEGEMEIVCFTEIPIIAQFIMFRNRWTGNVARTRASKGSR